jgi:hypothetical protein
MDSLNPAAPLARERTSTFSSLKALNFVSINAYSGVDSVIEFSDKKFFLALSHTDCLSVGLRLAKKFSIKVNLS